MNFYSKDEIEKLLEDYDLETIQQAALISKFIEEMALEATGQKQEAFYKQIVKENFKNDFITDSSLDSLDASSIKLAVNFYNNLLEGIGEAPISHYQFKKIFNHRIGKETMGEAEYAAFIGKINRAYLECNS